MRIPKCAVCGAKARWTSKTRKGEAAMCDELCSRAFRNGNDRGEQTAREVRSMWRRPIAVTSFNGGSTLQEEMEYHGWFVPPTWRPDHP